MIRAFTAIVLAEANPPTTGLTSFQLWTLVIAAVAAVGIGSITAAIWTAFTTGRRERGAWLRELQINANQDFYASVEAISIYVLVGPIEQALRSRQFDELAAAADGLGDLALTLTSKYQRIIHVGVAKTVDTAHIAYALIPTLALQALPLPGAVNGPALRQRAAAGKSISELATHLLLVMRRDMGLMPWSEWREWKVRYHLFKNRKLTAQQEQAKSPVDRSDYVHEEYDRVDQLSITLENWEVRRLSGDSSHTSPAEDTYRIDGPMTYVDPSGGSTLNFDRIDGKHHPQALLVKPRLDHWRLGVARGLPTEVEVPLLKDVMRLVSGHGKAFEPELDPYSQNLAESHLWMWTHAHEILFPNMYLEEWRAWVDRGERPSRADALGPRRTAGAS